MAGDASGSWRTRLPLGIVATFVAGGLVAAFTAVPPRAADDDVAQEQILRGRQLVLEHACGGACHGSFEGGENPAADGWLAGLRHPGQEFKIGPCALDPDAEPCFRTRPRNLTPDNLTGLGRFSERQIFNALRFGLRPGETADVEITSSTPGQGNFPENPKYLAPPMPWLAWRHMPDEDLWAIAAYLKRGLKPVSNRVEDSEGPPDFWAEAYAPEIPSHPAPAFPTENEVTPPANVVALEKVLRGRHEVIEHDCGACHGGGTNPANEGWLGGITAPDQEFLVGPCAVEPDAEPCFRMRPRNLTPDEETGLGRFSERQIFNALRFGLRPSETPDSEIASTVPGQGNHPADPNYLGQGMPWTAWRFMSDEDLWAIAAYLKYGLKPVSNEVEASDAPPDNWASAYTPDRIGPYPAPPFPTAQEVGQRPVGQQ